MKRRYKISYHNRLDKVEAEIIVKADHLPSHTDIMKILDHVLPERVGGWYKMETISKDDSSNGRVELDLSQLQLRKG